MMYVSWNYCRNIVILEIYQIDVQGNWLCIIDFMLCFCDWGCIFWGCMFVCIVELLEGMFCIIVCLCLCYDYGEKVVCIYCGSNYLCYEMGFEEMWLIILVLIEFVLYEMFFLLDCLYVFLLGLDELLSDVFYVIVMYFLECMQDYWIDWVWLLIIFFDY